MRPRSSFPRSASPPVVLMLLLASLLALTAAFPAATSHADSGTVILQDSTSCASIGGTWDSGASTCKLAGSFTVDLTGVIIVNGGVTLEILSTGALSLVGSGGSSLTLETAAMVLNYGLVKVANVGPITTEGVLIASGATFTNHGKVDVAPTGGGAGIKNLAITTLDNYGKVTVYNSAGVGILNGAGETINNYAGGVLNVANTGGTGVSNLGSLNNAGTINNFGTISNAGTLVNSGALNEECGGVFDNTGTLTGSAATDACHRLHRIPDSALPPILYLSTLGNVAVKGYFVGKVAGTMAIYNIPGINQTLLGEELAQGNFTLFPNAVSFCSEGSSIRVSGFFMIWWGGSATNSTEFILGDYSSSLLSASGFPPEPACSG